MLAEAPFQKAGWNSGSSEPLLGSQPGGAATRHPQAWRWAQGNRREESLSSELNHVVSGSSG